jgi:hypothetical protein
MACKYCSHEPPEYRVKPFLDFGILDWIIYVHEHYIDPENAMREDDARQLLKKWVSYSDFDTSRTSYVKTKRILTDIFGSDQFEKVKTFVSLGGFKLDDRQMDSCSLFVQLV